MRTINVHIGREWGQEAFGECVTFPEHHGSLLPAEILENLNRLLAQPFTGGSYLRGMGVLDLMTCSPLVLDIVRLAKKKDPDGLQVEVFWPNGTSAMVDRTGRFENWDPDFDVHSLVLAELLGP